MGVERTMVVRACKRLLDLSPAIYRCVPDSPGFDHARDLFAKARSMSRKFAASGAAVGDLGEQLQRARIRQANADAALKEQRLAQKSADLWPGAVVAECIRATVGAIADAARDIPAKVGLMVPPEVRADVEDKVARLLRQSINAATDAARDENLRAVALAAAESAEIETEEESEAEEAK